jgi:hypothetical protein
VSGTEDDGALDRGTTEAVAVSTAGDGAEAGGESGAAPQAGTASKRKSAIARLAGWSGHMTTTSGGADGHTMFRHEALKTHR